MNKLIIPALIFLFLIGCEGESLVVSGTNLISKEGISYDIETNEPFTGLAEWHYDNGQLQTFIHFAEGRRNGLNEDFYEDGLLAERSTYIEGKRNGLHEEYYRNGQLMERRHYIYGKGNGLWERFRENGSLETSKYYKNGVVISDTNPQYEF